MGLFFSMTTLVTTVLLYAVIFTILLCWLATTIHNHHVVVVSGLSIPSSSGRQQHRMPPSIQISPDRLSSPERYAAAMNMTVQQVQERKEEFRRSSENLHQLLRLVEEEQKQLKADSDCDGSGSSDGVGRNKHTLICEHRYEWGQHPFVCPKCWTYTPICVCPVAEYHHLDRYSQQRRSRSSSNSNKQLLEGIMEEQSQPSSPSTSSWLPPNLDVVIWTHHKEYGLTSNTGGLLPLLLDDHPNNDGDDDEEPTQKDDDHYHHRCYVLMKGLPQHDEWFQTNIIDKHNSGEYLVVVLWPTDERKKKQQDDDENKTPRSITLNEAKRILLETQKQQQQPQQQPQDHDYTSTNKIRRVVLIAVDGTWRNARRMVSRLPNSLPRLDLSPSKLDESGSRRSTSEDEGVTNKVNTSLLAPIRSRGPSQRKDGGEGLVCTAEAVTAALISLGLNQEDGDRILHLAKTKVDLVREYRGHESKVNKKR